MLDAHANEAFGDCDGMLGHELLEGDEEACLDSNAARNGRVECSRGSCDQVPKHVEHEAQDVRDHSHEHDEFGELLGAPCTLKIAPAIEDCEARYDEPQKVLLYDCRQCKHPWIYDRPAWHDGEVGDAISDANEGLFDLFHPVRVWSQCKVEQGEDDEAGEQAPSQRRQVYASHGMGWARDAGESEGG